MNRRSVAILAVTLLLAGCGRSDDGSGGETAADTAPAPRRIVPAAVLLSEQDLPKEEGPQGAARPYQQMVPAAFCGAEGILRDAGASVAKTKQFVTEGHRVSQVTGVFPTIPRARSAFDSLSSPRYRDCIVASLQRFAPRRFGDRGVLSLPLTDRDVGDEATLMRFEVVPSGGSSPPLVDAFQVRVGRIVSDLVFVSTQPVSLDRLAADTSEEATGTMESAQR